MPLRLRSHSANNPALQALPEAWETEQHQLIADQYVANQDQAMSAEENNNVNANANANANDPVQWLTNPLQGNFNPGTDAGRKIFKDKTRGLPEADRLDLSKSNSLAIQRYFKAREEHLETITNIPVEFNIDGSVKTTASLLSQSHLISLKDVQREAHRRFGNALASTEPIPQTPFILRNIDPGNNDPDKAIFYDRVRSSVTVELIKNCLSVMGYEDLMLQKEKFIFKGPNGKVEVDGATMAFLIYERIDPSTTVGLDSVLEAIENAKLCNYNNDIDKMLTDMDGKYKLLKENGEPPRNYRKLLFRALQSGSNASYNEFVSRIEDDVDSGLGLHKNIAPEELILASRTKFNNMIEKGSWNKVDPREAQMLALMTKIDNLNKQQQKPAPPPTSGQGTPAAHTTDGNQQQQSHDVVTGTSVETWRIKFEAPTKQHGGKTYYWCPHHVLEGKWNGLYVLHHPDKHRGKKQSSKAATPPAPAAEKSGLALNDRLKQVLCTNLCIPPEDVDKIFEEAASGN